MKKGTIVYAYKGLIGIKSAEDCAGLVNDPNEKNGMLYIVDVTHVKFSQEAIELLKKIPIGTDPIGDVTVYKAGNMVLFGFSGVPLRVMGKNRPIKKGEEIIKYVPVYAGVGCNPELLVASEDVTPDKSFMAYVDKLEAEGKLEEIKIDA